MLKFNRLNRFSVFSPEIISAMLIITFAYFAAVFYIAPIQSIAQNISSTRTNEVPSSIVMYRILVDDVAKSLQSGDMQAALVHLYIIKQQLASASTNSSVTQMVNGLVNDAINSLQIGHTEGVLLGLDLIGQQLDLAMDPNNVFILSNIGFDLNRIGNFSGGLKYADKALHIDPTNKYALNTKGNALYGLGNYTGAMMYYDKALEIDPNFVASLSNKGNVLTKFGNYTGAIKYYDKALAINHNFVYALDGRNIALSLSLNKSSYK
jgi:tetratricopeptide (TPR) repeat protein